MGDLLIRTVAVKLDVDGHAPLLSETAAAFSAAATWIARVCWDEGITNTNTAHHRVYGDARRHFGLGAQLAVCASAKAMEALTATRKKGSDRRSTFGAQASIHCDARTYRLLPLDRVSLGTLHGRVVCRMLPGSRQRAMLLEDGWDIGGADLVQRKGTWFLHLTQHRPAPPLEKPTGYLGVDLGMVNIATDSTGQNFTVHGLTGVDVQAVREKRARQRRRLQTRNTRRSRARLRKVARREARFQRDINHIVARALVAKAKESRNALALEDLTGINARIRVRRDDRQQRMSWAFYQLRLLLSYKARAAGVAVVLVNPRHTSRTCSQCSFCHKRNRPDRDHFRCLKCGFTAPADHNAARNIAARATVNWPIVLPPLSPQTAIASTSPHALAVGR